jgi:hypothetical protein
MGSSLLRIVEQSRLEGQTVAWIIHTAQDALKTDSSIDFTWSYIESRKLKAGHVRTCIMSDNRYFR